MNLIIKRLGGVPVWIIALGALAMFPLLAKPDTRPKPSAQELVSAAVKTAKAQNKTVMVHFSASWCGWCKRLDAFLNAPDVGKLMTDN